MRQAHSQTPTARSNKSTRKIIVLSFISLDGIMQAPGGPDEDKSGGFKHGGWTVPYFDDALGKIMGEQMSPRSDLLLGRITFEIFADYWPKHENNWPGINQINKYVFSNKLKDPTWNNTVILNSPQDIINLKHSSGPDLQVHGSSQLIQLLLENNLVDELWLKQFPVVLGMGKRLFGSGTVPASFSLSNSSVTPQGVFVANYKFKGDVQVSSF